MDKFIVIETVCDDIWFFLGGQMVDERPDRVEDKYYFVSDLDAAYDLQNLAAAGGRYLAQFMPVVTRTFRWGR